MGNAIRGLVCMLAVLAAGGAEAATQRSFVASSGVDTNPCTLIAPCRTFAQAIASTLPGGEVIVLDSAGYGPVTIAQAVSLIAPPGVYAGVSVYSGDGITINAGANDDVLLQGLHVNGLGGQAGIKFVAGRALYVRDCVVSGMQTNGIEAATINSTVSVTDTEVRANGGSGIYVQGSQKATLENVRAERNMYGVYARSGPQVAIRSSSASFNSQYGFAAEAATLDVQMSVSGSAAKYNSSGIWLSAALTRKVNVAVDDSAIEANGSGIVGQSAGGGQLTVANTRFVRNAGNGLVYGLPSADARQAVLARNVFDQNGGDGIDLVGATTVAILTGNLITRSLRGIYLILGATAYSRGDNTIGANTVADVAGGSLTALGGL